MNRMRILSEAKRKKGLTVRDFWYGDLEAMVHEGLLDKSYPKKGRGAGWPFYRISRRGKRSLVRTKREQSEQRRKAKNRS